MKIVLLAKAVTKAGPLSQKAPINPQALSISVVARALSPSLSYLVTLPMLRRSSQLIIHMGFPTF